MSFPAQPTHAQGEYQYLDLLARVFHQGDERIDRTGVGTKSLFGGQMRFDLSKGFPLLTTKKIHLKSVIIELLWLISGDTNIKFLKDNGVRIWDEWADKNGDLGPIYGKQWRRWEGARGQARDQLARVVDGIQKNPHSRRHIVTAWNPIDIDEMALPPCHALFQFHVANGQLSCQLYQRSADMFLGVPFNIASYSLLTMMVAQVCGLKPGFFVHSLGDYHIYLNHLEQVKTQLFREVRPFPAIILNPERTWIDNWEYEDFTLQNYNPHPHIAGKVAV